MSLIAVKRAFAYLLMLYGLKTSARIPQPQDFDFENAVRTNENFNKSSANKNNGNKAAKHAAAACFAAVFTVAAILILMLILFFFLLTAK